MGSSTPEPRPSTASESRKLVAEYEQKLKSAKEQDQASNAESVRQRRIRRATMLFGALAIALYLTLNPPNWIQPPPAPAPTPAQREASDRFAIYLQAQRIEHYRNTTGRLPSTMEEAGEPMPGLRYEVLGDGAYAITSSRDQAIRFTSRDSLGAFLGGSMTLLGGPR